ncbi:MAG TPA: hypothetical protein VN649_18480, partial [Ramlibacter sp.]|nr:hypothetical protein [Ramlibacter sp.]
MRLAAALPVVARLGLALAARQRPAGAALPVALGPAAGEQAPAGAALHAALVPARLALAAVTLAVRVAPLAAALPPGQAGPAADQQLLLPVGPVCLRLPRAHGNGHRAAVALRYPAPQLPTPRAPSPVSGPLLPAASVAALPARLPVKAGAAALTQVLAAAQPLAPVQPALQPLARVVAALPAEQAVAAPIARAAALRGARLQPRPARRRAAALHFPRRAGAGDRRDWRARSRPAPALPVVPLLAPVQGLVAVPLLAPTRALVAVRLSAPT